MHLTKTRLILLITAAVITVIVSVSTVLGFTQLGITLINQQRYLATQPSCDQALPLSVTPIDSSGFDNIIPLGNFNPPDHTLPTDHIYFVFKRTGSDYNNSTAIKTNVYSPGNILITHLTKSTTMRNGTILSDDYKVNFKPCSQVEMYFDHVNVLSQKLADSISQQKSFCSESHPGSQDTYRYCNYEMAITLQAGDQIGVAGMGTSSGLDFGVYDLRTQQGTFANNARYRDQQLHVVCPIDLLKPDLKNQYYTKFGSSTKIRTIEPKCGTIYQDKPGTLQGSWFNGSGLADTPDNWSKTITLAHDNSDPSIGAIALGGVFTNPGMIYFTPTHTGTINREFSEITDSQYYCYEGPGLLPTQAFSSQAPRTKVVLQMSDPNTLKIEKQGGSCSGTFSISNPTIYTR